MDPAALQTCLASMAVEEGAEDEVKRVPGDVLYTCVRYRTPNVLCGRFSQERLNSMDALPLLVLRQCIARISDVFMAVGLHQKCTLLCRE